MKKLFYFSVVITALIGCNKLASTTQTTEQSYSNQVGELCEEDKDTITCVTMTGAKINPLSTVDIYAVIPESVFNYDEDDYEILSDKDQYIHLQKDCADSITIQLADIYNTLTMMHNLTNDIEVTERYEVSTSIDISHMKCSIIRNPSWRKLVEHVRNEYAKANRTMDETDLENAYAQMGEVYKALNVIAEPLMETTGDNYTALCNRSSYMDDFAKYESKRGTDDKTYQRQLLAQYAQSSDFDWKCIWALEFAHSSKENAAFMGGAAILEEVMLSKTYSPYLDEIWATWRAMVTTPFGLSNFSYIPNIFYNKMRLICATTILNFIHSHNEDKLAQGIFINLANHDNIVRHGCLYGNSSTIEQMNLFSEWEKEDK